MENDSGIFPYYTSNGYTILFGVDDPGIYMQNISDSVLHIDVYDRARMLQSSAVMPDYTAFLLLQTLDALQALEDNGGVAAKTIEIPPGTDGVRKSIILSNSVNDFPTPQYEIPDEYLARIDGPANSNVINMGFLETNLLNGNHMVKTYELNGNDAQFDKLTNFLYTYFEMNRPKNNAYGYPTAYYYEHVDEFFD